MTLTGKQNGQRRVQCSGRTQGAGCTEPSFFAHVVEDQIGCLLQTFTVESGRRDHLVQAWERAQHEDVSIEAKRRNVKQQLNRLRDLYVDGDLNRADYQMRRDAMQRELDALPHESGQDTGSADRLASYLADVGAAWADASPDERNRLARELFTETVLTNKTAAAVVPRPELRPFFEVVAHDEITLRRKRRGSVALRRYGDDYIIMAEAQRVERVGHSKRAKLAIPRAAIAEPTRERIRQLAADGRSLRKIAEDVGVSHESVRQVLVAATLSVEA